MEAQALLTRIANYVGINGYFDLFLAAWVEGDRGKEIQADIRGYAKRAEGALKCYHNNPSWGTKDGKAIALRAADAWGALRKLVEQY